MLSFDDKHPVILPSVTIRRLSEINNSVTARIIYQTHLVNQHAGVDWLLNHLRTNLWILAGRRTVKNVIGRCIACQRAIKRPARERMAVLTAARFPNQIPWTYVGVDFTGPFRLKGGKRGNIVTKGYILIFTDLQYQEESISRSREEWTQKSSSKRLEDSYRAEESHLKCLALKRGTL